MVIFTDVVFENSDRKRAMHDGRATKRKANQR